MLLACADQEAADRADLIPASRGAADGTAVEGGLERRGSSRLLDSADDLRPLTQSDAADLDSAAGHRIRGGEAQHRGLWHGQRLHVSYADQCACSAVDSRHLWSLPCADWAASHRQD